MGRTPQQAGRMARRKGMAFQNQIAKMLTDAWGVPVLWTPMSGGLSIRGDLMIGGNPPTHVLAVNIECKHRQDITLRRVLLDVTRLPVEKKQMVFFKDDGIIWMAWDVVEGPNVAPPQLGLKDPPVYIRVKPVGENATLVGIVKINYYPGLEYLRAIKPCMVHRVPKKEGVEEKKSVRHIKAGRTKGGVPRQVVEYNDRMEMLSDPNL